MKLASLRAQEAAEVHAVLLRPKLAQCPVCGESALRYMFRNQGTPVVQCKGCSLLMRNPQPSDHELGEIYTASYFLGAEQSEFTAQLDFLRRRTAVVYLEQIERYRKRFENGAAGMHLVEIGCGRGNFLLEARDRGYQVSGVDLSEAACKTANKRLGQASVKAGAIADAGLPSAAFDVCVLADVIEHTRDPAEFMRHVHRILKPGGVLFIAVPSLDSWSAKLLRQRWMEFKAEHLYYFSRDTIGNLLFRAGFSQIKIAPGVKVLSQEYIYQHFTRFPIAGATAALRVLRALTPRFLRLRPISVVASGINVLARREDLLPPSERTQKLSIIMPVYNEKNTFSQVMRDLLAKDIPGLEMEVIVVESNSSDGTREEVQRFSSDPRVRLILEERPRGKGHAVRTGLAQATGDFVLIQDADLEYDLDDYELLLEPLRTYRQAFVLGSRHSANTGWKLRRFEGQFIISVIWNVGHVLLTGLFNLFYGQQLRDPFTMYKVFRRQCLDGLTFECNRFDFDWELVAKLVRRGYSPLEIPINYVSRSFAEGKKVSFFRDLPTWIRALIKYRLVRLDA